MITEKVRSRAAQGDDGLLYGAWPRQHMEAAPLVVFHLDALAPLAPGRLWPPGAEPQLHIRSGSAELLAALSELVQVGIVVRHGPGATLALRELHGLGCRVDAVVDLGRGRTPAPAPGLDLSGVCAALGLPSAEAAARVLVVGTLALSHADIEAREGSEVEELAPFVPDRYEPQVCPRPATTEPHTGRLGGLAGSLERACSRACSSACSRPPRSPNCGHVAANCAGVSTT